MENLGSSGSAKMFGFLAIPDQGGPGPGFRDTGVSSTLNCGMKKNDHLKN